ncbi:MAG TPA: hypothetical protein VHV51_13610 [Polyangiaceae bacterium]|jgi:hypothetical protein|nr:hypothetical protein [Polyangiaceae bacterium]
MSFSRFVLGASWLATCPACSFVDPHAGPTQTECGISFGGSAQTGAGSSYYGSTAHPTAAGPSCALSTDNSCDQCETTHCCATRSACYGDPSCACADQALDACLDQAETSSNQGAQQSLCWNAFSARGTAEQARVACQRAWCQSECEVP